MPRKNSLTREDFVRAGKAKLRRARGALFILAFGRLPGQKTAEIKASCVVSKKTASRATERNLIKRKWREAMRSNLSGIPAPCMLIFYAMRPAKDASFADIKIDVEALVARVGAELRGH